MIFEIIFALESYGKKSVWLSPSKLCNVKEALNIDSIHLWLCPFVIFTKLKEFLRKNISVTISTVASGHRQRGVMWLGCFFLLYLFQALRTILLAKCFHWTVCICKTLSHQCLVLRGSLIQPENKSSPPSVYVGCINWTERMLSSKNCLLTGNSSNPSREDQTFTADSSKPRDTIEFTLLLDFRTSSWNNMKE